MLLTGTNTANWKTSIEYSTINCCAATTTHAISNTTNRISRRRNLMQSNDHEIIQRFLSKLIRVAWALLLLSSLSLLCSIMVFEHDWLSAIFLMASRTFGIAVFLVGAVAIFNGLWGHGVTLFMGSIFLPLIAYYLFGTI